MFPLMIHHMSLALLAAFLLVAAYQDLCDYRIPNVIIISLLALYPIYVLSAPHGVDILWSLAIGGVFFMIGLGLFVAKVMGGGDVKLIAVTGLWVGLEGLVPFLVVMAIVGGAMSVFMLVGPLRHTTAYLCSQMGLYSAQQKIMTDKLPYGVAICAGGLYAAFHLFLATRF